jgi:glucokinase
MISIVKEHVENFDKKQYESFVFGADLGGTNTKISVAGLNKNSLELIFSLYFKTSEITSFSSILLECLNIAKSKFDIEILNGCISAAGVVSEDKKHVSLTNQIMTVNIDELIIKTGLKSILLINDFEAVGYGINLLDFENEKEVYTIRNNLININSKKTRAVIGAGTGLGKSILVYDEEHNFYNPISSEGGHCDFPIYNEFDRELVNYIKNKRSIVKPLTYDELLSGRGIEIIYQFLKEKYLKKITKYTKEIDISKDKPPLISKYKNLDDTCKKVLSIFTIFYARCAKNFVLDSLATGGLFLAGGIASKNKEIFNSKKFFNEFENVYQYSPLLKKIPLFVILDENIGLKGACFAALKRYKGLKR